MRRLQPEDRIKDQTSTPRARRTEIGRVVGTPDLPPCVSARVDGEHLHGIRPQDVELRGRRNGGRRRRRRVRRGRRETVARIPARAASRRGLGCLGRAAAVAGRRRRLGRATRATRLHRRRVAERLEQGGQPHQDDQEPSSDHALIVARRLPRVNFRRWFSRQGSMPGAARRACSVTCRITGSSVPRQARNAP